METVSESAKGYWARKLRHQGYCIVPKAVPNATISMLDNDLGARFQSTPFGQGGFYGETTKRFGRLLAHSVHTAELVQHSLVLAIVEEILSPFCDRVQLNVAQAIAVHPGAPAQLPHRDQDMWRAPIGATEYLVNVIWPLTRFTDDNGATIIWPQSHGAAALEQVPRCDPVAAIMEPGSALIFLGSALHCAGANVSEAVRRGIVVGYSLGWLKPYENQWLAYPPELARSFEPDLAALVGYRQHRPNLGNYEGQCPSVLLYGDARKPLGAVDALRPDQQAQLAVFLDSQRQAM